MVSWEAPGWCTGHRCDAPNCDSPSCPDNCVISSAVIGPAMDLPLRLFYCDEHADVARLFERYREPAPVG